MKTLFHTVITTERHRERGFCEDSDFGKIELLELLPEEKQLVVSFKDYDKEIEYIEHDGYAYKKIGVSSGVWGFSKEEEEKIISKQGKFSQKYVLDLVLKIRARMERTFSCVGSASFILIGRTLYTRYSKIEDLNITTCGNCMFSHWLNVDIEAHGGKVTYPLSKTSLKEVVKERKAYWESTKPVNGTRGDGHSIFSQPLSVKWGKKYNV